MGTTQIISEGWGVPFMMQAWWGFCLCSAIYVTTSLLTKAPASEAVEDLVWGSPKDVLTEGEFRGVGDPRVLGGALFVLLVALYALFR